MPINILEGWRYRRYNLRGAGSRRQQLIMSAVENNVGPAP